MQSQLSSTEPSAQNDQCEHSQKINCLYCDELEENPFTGR